MGELGCIGRKLNALNEGKVSKRNGDSSWIEDALQRRERSAIGCGESRCAEGRTRPNETKDSQIELCGGWELGENAAK